MPLKVKLKVRPNSEEEEQSSRVATSAKKGKVGFFLFLSYNPDLTVSLEIPPGSLQYRLGLGRHSPL